MACRKIEIFDEVSVIYTPDTGIPSATLMEINQSPKCTVIGCRAECFLRDNGIRGGIYQYRIETRNDTCQSLLSNFSLTF